MSSRAFAHRQYLLPVKRSAAKTAQQENRHLRVSGFSRYELELFCEEIFDKGCYRDALTAHKCEGGCVVDVGAGSSCTMSRHVCTRGSQHQLAAIHDLGCHFHLPTRKAVTTVSCGATHALSHRRKSSVVNVAVTVIRSRSHDIIVL
jgi:hypothetical protein